MPDVKWLSGYPFLKRQADTKTYPHILVSGEEQYSGKIWAKNWGPAVFSGKAVEKDHLLRVVHKVLDHYSNR